DSFKRDRQVDRGEALQGGIPSDAGSGRSSCILLPRPAPRNRRSQPPETVRPPRFRPQSPAEIPCRAALFCRCPAAKARRIPVRRPLFIAVKVVLTFGRAEP